MTDQKSRSSDDVTDVTCAVAILSTARQNVVFCKDSRHMTLTVTETPTTRSPARLFGPLLAWVSRLRQEEKYFYVDLHLARYFSRFMVGDVTRILRHVTIKEQFYTGTKVLIKFKGQKGQVTVAHELLSALRSRVMSRDAVLCHEFQEPDDLDLVTAGIKSRILRHCLDQLETEHRCLVDLHWTPDTQDTQDTSDTSEKPDTNPSGTSCQQRSTCSQPRVEIFYDIRNVNLLIHTNTSNYRQVVGDFLWRQVKRKIIECCLHTSVYNLSKTHQLVTSNLTRFINSKAKGLNVILVWPEDPDLEGSVIKIRGERSAVDKLKCYLDKSFALIQTKLDAAKTKPAPVEFLQYAGCQDQVPAYWASSLHGNGDDVTKVPERIVEVDDRTKSAITRLVEDTWDRSRVGAGRDAIGLRHTGIQVCAVKRIENPRLFSAYSAERRRLLETTRSQKRVCTPVGQVKGSSGNVVTSDLLDESMKSELYHDVNEHYLFHGTKCKFIDAIVNNGLDPRVGRQDGLLGKGIYTAEKSTKADQYTDCPFSRHQSGTYKTMLLVRVLLGDVCLMDDTHDYITRNEKLTRPPCMQCEKDKCACANQQLYGSVMADGKWLFREFVVYDKNHCYPEYIIKYLRV